MLKSFILCLVLSPLLAAAASPLVFQLIQSIWGSNPWPFSRVFDRVFLASFLACVWFLRKRFDLSKLAVAYQAPKWVGSRLVFVGFAAAFLISVLCLPQFITGSPLAWKEIESQVLIGRLVSTLLSAFVIAVLEEGVFRLLFVDALRSKFNVLTAAIVTSAVYALVHFLSPVYEYTLPTDWALAGFSYLGQVFSRLSLPGIPQGLLGLFLAGLVLVAARMRTGSLHLSIGLHAGWILALKLAVFSTMVTDSQAFPSGVGRRYFMVSEPLGWAVIVGSGLLALLLVQLFTWRKAS